MHDSCELHICNSFRSLMNVTRMRQSGKKACFHQTGNSRMRKLTLFIMQEVYDACSTCACRYVLLSTKTESLLNYSICTHLANLFHALTNGRVGLNLRKRGRVGIRESKIIAICKHHKMCQITRVAVRPYRIVNVNTF